MSLGRKAAVSTNNILAAVKNRPPARRHRAPDRLFSPHQTARVKETRPTSPEKPTLRSVNAFDMAYEEAARAGLLELVRHHRLGPDQLVGLIVMAHRALASLGLGAPEEEAPQPAVLIRRSVQRDYVVCLESGLRPGAAPPFAGAARARGRRVSYPLEFTVGSPGDGTGLFGATLGYR